jgi:hypothetical protein
MQNIWSGGNARVANENVTIHDYGACTVPQLLFGYDANLEERIGEQNGNLVYTDDFSSFNDGVNPCLQDGGTYYEYLQEKFELEGPVEYDFIIMNDNTRSPARSATRTAILEVLEALWVPMLTKSGATPVFISTYGYSTPYRDMGGLSSVPEFTSLTYEGYREYAEILQEVLPMEQKPRIALVGHAFLIVWEENYNLWLRLFSVDKIHASPMGSYLQGCVLYHTLFDSMPLSTVAIRGDMSYLWKNARRFQPGDHRRSSFPTIEEAKYLYNVASRVARHGAIPKTFTIYHNNEAADYLPQDDLYRIDDLF